MGTTAYELSKPKRRKPKTKKSQGNWGGIVECPMGKEERDRFLDFIEKGSIDVFTHMTRFCDDGVNLSMAYDERNSAYNAKATMINPDDNKRYMLTAFHGDVETAWSLLFFKHFHLLGEEWFKDEEAIDEMNNWG